MTDNRSTKNEGIQANNIKAEVMAVGSHAHAEQHKIVQGGDAQATLDDLLTQLKEALAQVPAAQREDAEAVETLAHDLAQTSSQETPNKKLLEIKAESLKAAAKNLAEVAPTVMLIATQVVNHILTGGR